MSAPTTPLRDLIAEWRASHPGERLTYAVLCKISGLDNLRGADLTDADLTEAILTRADLTEADLRGAILTRAILTRADLTYADLRGAILAYADLTCADLSYADLSYADLTDADLTHAILTHAHHDGILSLSGLPSGPACAVPTPGGWKISIGCWRNHSIDDLRALIASDEGWPEAEGVELEARRPLLQAWLALIEANATYRAGVIESLAEKWGTAA